MQLARVTLEKKKRFHIRLSFHCDLIQEHILRLAAMSGGSVAKNQCFENRLCPHHQGHDYSQTCPQTDFKGNQFPDNKDKGGP
jgi:hypothetical protein